MDDGQGGLLHRLYRTKLTLLAVILTVAGLALLVLAQVDGIKQIELLPLKDLGGALVSAGVIAIALDYMEGRDSEARTRSQLRSVIEEMAPVIRASVLDGFSATAEDFERIASVDKTMQVAEKALAVGLKQPELARAVVQNLRRQVDRSAVTSSDTRVSITLTPWADGPATGPHAMFVADFVWEHHLATLPRMERFYCVSDRSRYRDATADPTSPVVWFFPTTKDISAGSPDAFELVRYAINGVPQDIGAERDASGQCHTVTLDQQQEATARGYHVAYHYRVLIPQHGHALSFSLTKPSNSLSITFTHHQCNINSVSAHEFFTSAHPPRVYTSPVGAVVPTITVGCDDWVLPGSGVTFTWTLNREIAVL
ncbi:hypothetical protein [Crossiella sp. CA198]|uniref:hypothetical protein n=1 Tax=Crossiella sp. CA198 TaxID=3455607 RepID=UPI003F8D3627